MYSVVLMMAMSGGAEVPDSCGRCGCFCSGCSCNSCGCFCNCGGGCHRDRCHHRCHNYCHGCYACHGCAVACQGCCGGTVSPPDKMDPKKKKGEEEASATIIVSLPAEARLTIDGNATRATNARRVFTSPALEPGQDYVYTLRAEIVRDGQTVAETQQVTVRAGQEVPVQFSMTSTGVASR